MTISLSDAGKRFNRDWIFRHFNYTFESGQSYAITGPNGSGKSTLLQVLSGGMYINEGSLVFSAGSSGSDEKKSTPILPENIYQQVSICAPYLEVVEEMTATEFLDFHQAFKPFLPGTTTAAVIAAVGLEKEIGRAHV